MHGGALEAAELIDERSDERLDTARLEPYLRAHLEGADGALSGGQFAGGQGNPPPPCAAAPRKLRASSCCDGRRWGRSRRGRTTCAASTASSRYCIGAMSRR